MDETENGAPDLVCTTEPLRNGCYDDLAYGCIRADGRVEETENTPLDKCTMARCQTPPSVQPPTVKSPTRKSGVGGTIPDCLAVLATALPYKVRTLGGEASREVKHAAKHVLVL